MIARADERGLRQGNLDDRVADTLADTIIIRHTGRHYHYQKGLVD